MSNRDYITIGKPVFPNKAELARERAAKKGQKQFKHELKAIGNEILVRDNVARANRRQRGNLSEISNFGTLGQMARSKGGSSYRAGMPSSLKDPSRIKPSIKGAPRHIEDYVKLLLNVHDSEVVQAPSPVPFRSTASRQVLTQDLATWSNPFPSGASTNQFYGEVQPNIDNTLLLTTPAAAWEAANTLGFSGDCWGSATSNGAYMQGGYSYSNSSPNIMVAGQALESGALSGHMGFPLINTNANAETGNLNITPMTPIDEPIQCIVMAYTTAGGWTQISSGELSANGLVLGPAFPSNMLAWSLFFQTIENGDAEYLRVSFTYFGRTSGTGTHRFAQVPKNVTATQTTLLKAVTSVQYSRITALDVLGTFQGSDMTNGGSVASARVPKFWGSSSSNAYNEMLVIPYDTYDGELKHGWHTHWVPQCLDDISPTIEIEQFDEFGSSKLVFGGTINTAGQSVRVRASIVVEFYTTDPSYGPMTYTPPPHHMADALYYVCTQIPACTSNKSHIVKKLGALGSGYLAQALHYLQNHPELISQIGNMIAAGLLG